MYVVRCRRIHSVFALLFLLFAGLVETFVCYFVVFLSLSFRSFFVAVFSVCIRSSYIAFKYDGGR